MKGRVRQPCLIKMQRLNLTSQGFFERLNVVKHAVISGLRDGQNTRLGFLVFDKRIGFNFLTDAFCRKLFQRNRADDAQMIAGRHQKNRVRTGHDDGVQNRFMTVAIHNHNIARRDVGMPHHFVRGRSAVGHKEAVICIKNPRGIAL